MRLYALRRTAWMLLMEILTPVRFVLMLLLDSAIWVAIIFMVCAWWPA